MLLLVTYDFFFIYLFFFFLQDFLLHSTILFYQNKLILYELLLSTKSKWGEENYSESKENVLRRK